MENQINFFTVQDIYNHADKQIDIDITKVYDPLHFWEDYGDKYFKGFDKPQEFHKYIAWLLMKLKVLKVDTLYDAGCGFCRVEPFLLEAGVVKDITAVDISQKQLDCAKIYLTPTIPLKPQFKPEATEEERKKADEEFKKTEEDYTKAVERIKHIDIRKQTLKWSTIPPDSYDCTMTVECMQHLPISSVRYAIKELQKLSRKYVIIVERFVFDGEHPVPHLWSHNYAKMMTDIGLKLIEATILGNGMVGMVFKK